MVCRSSQRLNANNTMSNCLKRLYLPYAIVLQLFSDLTYKHAVVLCKVLAEDIRQVNVGHSEVLSRSCCQNIAGSSPPSCRHCAYAVDASPRVQITISQPCQLPRICADAAFADECPDISLPRCTRPLDLQATRANKATASTYDKQEPADLLPYTRTYLQEPPSKRQPTNCEAIQVRAPPHSGKERSSCLKQQDGDIAHAARAQKRTGMYEGPAQKCTKALSDTTCAVYSTLQHPDIAPSNGQSTDSYHQIKLQSGAGQIKQSSKRALRICSRRPPRKQEASASLSLSTDCTAILYTASSQATGETFSLHAWCASIDAASSVPTERHAVKDVYASRERALRNTIVQFAAGTHNPHGEPCKSRKKRRFMTGIDQVAMDCDQT